MSDSNQRDDVPTTDTPEDRTLPTDQPPVPEIPSPDPDGPQETDSPAIDPLPPMGGPS